MKIQTILIFACLLLSACTDSYDVESIIEAKLDKNKPCLELYGGFPMTIPETYWPKYSPILDEFIALGYVNNYEAKQVPNMSPAVAEMINVRVYTVTEEGEDIIDGNRKVCYGEFELVDITGSDSLPMIGAIMYKAEVDGTSFEYAIKNVPSWAMKDVFSELSDKLFDDLSTQKNPGMGSLVMRKRDEGVWRVVNFKIETDRPSQDLSNSRNKKIAMKEIEKYYQHILVVEKTEERPEVLLKMYGNYSVRSSLHAAEVGKRMKALASEVLGNKKSQEDEFLNLANQFFDAINNRDQETISRITTGRFSASRALRNNIFERKKLGDVKIKSYKVNKTKDSVQIQLAGGGIFMLRAKRVDGKWLLTEFATQTSWFRKNNS